MSGRKAIRLCRETSASGPALGVRADDVKSEICDLKFTG